MWLLFKSVVNTITRAMQGLGHVALENSIMISQRIFRWIAMWCLFLWIFSMVIYGAMLIEKLTALAIRLDSKIHGKTCIGWKQAGAVDTVQDFLIKLGFKPHMRLLKISIFSINNFIVRLNKIMNRADNNWADF